MKAAGRLILSTFVAGIVHLSVFQGLWIISCGISFLFVATTVSARYFTASGCVLCYLPALLTGILLERVKGSFRPSLTAPLGVMLSWALFLGFGVMGWPYAYWTADQNGVVPWLFDYWTIDHNFASLLVLVTTGLTAALAVEWRQPQQEAKWLSILLLIFNLMLGVAAIRYSVLPHINVDEVEHIHVSWVLSQGIIPYRDIHQPHMPLLWMLTWPVMCWLPHTFEAVLALRSVCVPALIGSYIAGLLMLREIFGGLHRVHALLLLLFMLAVVPDFQLYMFRPDPFMTLCSAWGILAVVRMRRAPARYAFLCGIAFGLAAAFSIRLSWLCFLVPIVALWECVRERALRPLWLVLPNGAGFVLGILPVMIWIAYHGALRSFWTWVVLANSGSIHNPFAFQWQETLPETVIINKLLAAFAVLGGVTLLWSQWRGTKQAWSPANGVLAGAVLAWLVPLTNPIHWIVQDNHYHFQLVMIPGAVLATVFVARLLAWNTRAWQLRLAAVAALFVLIEVQTPAPNGPARRFCKASSGTSARCVPATMLPAFALRRGTPSSATTPRTCIWPWTKRLPCSRFTRP